ncbi:hypothetical protein LTR95_007856 [Oleoguttula sp. CCFEE 5521]
MSLTRAAVIWSRAAILSAAVQMSCELSVSGPKIATVRLLKYYNEASLISTPKDALALGRMAFDDAILESKYAIARMRIRSGTQVSTRTAQVISKLASPTPDDLSPALVVLQASNRDANKLITVTEIAKRDLLSNGIQVFQYTALSSQMIEIERKPAPKPPTATGAGGEEGEVSDDAFQTIGETDIKVLGPKTRAVPVLTVYLASRPVRELKVEFGEQRS